MRLSISRQPVVGGVFDWHSFSITVLLYGASLFAAFWIEQVFRMGWLSLLIFFVYLLQVFLTRPKMLIKFFFIYYQSITNIVGVFICEQSGFYLRELGVFSHFAGSVTMIVGYSILFLATINCFNIFNEEHYEPIDGRKTRLLSGFLWIAASASFMVFVLALSNPFYANNVDRFQYVNLGFIPKLTSTYVAYAQLLIPVAAIGFLSSCKASSTAFLALYAATGFLTGNKFGMFLVIFYIAILACYPLVDSQPARRIRRYLCCCVLVFAALLLVVAVHNSLLLEYSAGQNAEYFGARLAQQGQLWWSTYEQEQYSSPRYDELDDEISTWFFGSGEPMNGNYGIYKIMKHDVIDESLFVSKISSGSRYAFSTQASVYYYFGFAGLLIYAVCAAMVYALLIGGMINFLQKRDCLCSIFFFKFIQIAHLVMLQSDFDVLFSWKTGVYVLGFLVALAVTQLAKEMSNRLRHVITWRKHDVLNNDRISMYS